MKKANILFKTIGLFLVLTVTSTVLLYDLLQLNESQAAALGLPEPNVILESSGEYYLPVLKGLKLDPSNPLNISFIVDTADKNDFTINDSEKLIKYFMTALAVPKEALWVNLSPYENDRILQDSVSQTDLGKDMMEQDYILKQMSSSLTSPETELGKAYWNSTKIGDNFNKVWIVPDYVKVYEHENSAVIAESALKVQTEHDYLALKTNELRSNLANSGLESLIDELDYLVNHSKHFAKTRQIFSAVILALWFKERFADSFYRYYMNAEKINGIDLSDISYKEKIFELYLKSSKKGVYDYIKTQKNQKINYFSGGQNYRDTLTSSSIVNDKSMLIRSLNLNNEENYKGKAMIVDTNMLAANSSSALEIDSGELFDKGYLTFEKDGKSYLYTMRTLELNNGEQGRMFEVVDVTDKENVELVGIVHLALAKERFVDIKPMKKLLKSIAAMFVVTKKYDAYIKTMFDAEEMLLSDFSDLTKQYLKNEGFSVRKYKESLRLGYSNFTNKMDDKNAIEVLYKQQGFARLLYVTSLQYAKQDSRTSFGVINTQSVYFFEKYIADEYKDDAKRKTTNQRFTDDTLRFDYITKMDNFDWHRINNNSYVRVKSSSSALASELTIDIDEYLDTGFYEFEKDGEPFLSTIRYADLEGGKKGVVFEVFEVIDKKRPVLRAHAHLTLSRKSGSKQGLFSKIATVLGFKHDAYLSESFYQETLLNADFRESAKKAFEKKGYDYKTYIVKGTSQIQDNLNAIQTYGAARSFGHLLYGACLSFAKRNDLNKFGVINTLRPEFFSKYLYESRAYLTMSRNNVSRITGLDNIDYSFSLNKDVNWGSLKNQYYDLSSKNDKSNVESSSAIKAANTGELTETKKLGGIDFKDTKIDIAKSKLSKELLEAPFELEGFQGFEFDINHVRQITSQDKLNSLLAY